MKRLTYVDKDGIVWFNVGDYKATIECLAKNKCYTALKQIAERLAQHEDLEGQGKLIKLPCKVGDKVYAYCNKLGYILSYSIEQIIINYDDFNKNDYYVFDALASSNGELLDAIDVVSDDIGKTVFLTIEEAEAALKRNFI